MRGKKATTLFVLQLWLQSARAFNIDFNIYRTSGQVEPLNCSANAFPFTDTNGTMEVVIREGADQSCNCLLYNSMGLVWPHDAHTEIYYRENNSLPWELWQTVNCWNMTTLDTGLRIRIQQGISILITYTYNFSKPITTSSNFLVRPVGAVLYIWCQQGTAWPESPYSAPGSYSLCNNTALPLHQRTKENDDTTAPIIGGVIGASAMLIALIVLVLVVLKRNDKICKSKPKRAETIEIQHRRKIQHRRTTLTPENNYENKSVKKATTESYNNDTKQETPDANQEKQDNNIVYAHLDLKKKKPKPKPSSSTKSRQSTEDAIIYGQVDFEKTNKLKPEKEQSIKSAHPDQNQYHIGTINGSTGNMAPQLNPLMAPENHLYKRPSYFQANPGARAQTLPGPSPQPTVWPPPTMSSLPGPQPPYSQPPAYHTLQQPGHPVAMPQQQAMFSRKPSQGSTQTSRKSKSTKQSSVKVKSNK